MGDKVRAGAGHERLDDFGGDLRGDDGDRVDDRLEPAAMDRQEADRQDADQR